MIEPIKPVIEVSGGQRIVSNVELAQKLNEVIEVLNTGHYHEIASDGMFTEADQPYAPVQPKEGEQK